MLLVNFIPSSEVVRTRWWVYDLALAVSLLVGGFVLTAYTLGLNHSQVEAVALRSKKLETNLAEKAQVLSLIAAKNQQLRSLGLASERVFAEDADKVAKAELPFVIHQLLKKLPADMWLTRLEAQAKVAAAPPSSSAQSGPKLKAQSSTKNSAKASYAKDEGSPAAQTASRQVLESPVKLQARKRLPSSARLGELGERQWLLEGYALSYPAIARFLGLIAQDNEFRKALAAARLSLGELSLVNLSRDLGSDTISYTITLSTKDVTRNYAQFQDPVSTDHRL